MSAFDVNLGGFIFQNFEVPSCIPFGGRQMHVTNIMIGGGRVVDALGWDPGDISWKGRFDGPNALNRATALLGMAQAGIAVPLMWDGLYYTVLIDKFHPDFEKHFEIPYEITLTVVNDPTQGGFGFASATLDQLVASDMTIAMGLLN